ncbi:GGDEF domain-containing protein [Tindallia californiensis]|uniref:Diguanylate cyclase (GGDEF) domain-containing protein n=1 Tax=Tindallia californiensis TaxID=159292 RepID=A0A1H3R769_9FIRM|nr:GGDEF domain-containing protein [Tindallia californiensis]SDZ21624.1 diguanylate cyclase (GGDEF) domain-containing protein [Tindallia californiensis]
MPHQRHLFRFILLYCIIVSIINMVTNIALSLPYRINIKWAILFLLSFSILLTQRKKGESYPAKILFFLYLILFFMPIGFFDAGGSQSASIGYLVLTAVLITTLLSGKHRLFFLGILLLLFQCLLVAEYHYPHWVSSHSPASLLYDRLIQVPIILGSTFLALRHHSYAFEETHSQLETAVSTDTLTTLYNRGKLDSALSIMLSRYHQHKHPFSILLIDMDHFKRINDTYGHPAGDRVLKEFAQILTHNIRKTDIAGRWGGEEFMIILPDANSSIAYTISEKIRKAAQNNLLIGNHKVTVSIGITEVQHRDTLSRIIKRVDNALYQAKHQGRNRVIQADTFSPFSPTEF